LNAEHVIALHPSNSFLLGNKELQYLPYQEAWENEIPTRYFYRSRQRKK